MSHAATNWAIRIKGIKPATKIVLWHLCDRHNADTGRCNPSQERLAEDAEMSRSTLNVHLGRLEAMGLIERITSIDPRTKRQLPTAYRLAMDTDIEPVAEPQDVVAPVSGKSPKPCPENRQSRVRNPDTNPVREPGREPRRAKDTPMVEALASVVSEKAALDFVEHRRELKAPLTLRAAQITASKLKGMPDPEACISQSIMQGWKGVFEVKGTGSNKASRTYGATDSNGGVDAGPFGFIREHR